MRMQIENRHALDADSLILTFSLGKKEPPLPLFPFERDGRAAPVRGTERCARWLGWSVGTL